MNNEEILIAEVIVRFIDDPSYALRRLEIEVTERNKQSHYITESMPRNDIVALLPRLVDRAINHISRIIEISHKS